MEDKEPRDFEKDLAESNRPEIYKIWCQQLKNIFGRDIIIKNKDGCIASQLDFGCDLIIEEKSGRRFPIELKTKSFKYAHYNSCLLEIKHHHATESTFENIINNKPGWLYKSCAKYVIWGTYNKDRNNFIQICCHSLEPFKNTDFAKNISKLKLIFTNPKRPTKFNSGIFQRTLNREASYDFLKQHGTFFYNKKLGGNLNDY